MKCNCLLLLILLHFVKSINLAKQIQYQGYQYVSPFSAHAYLTNPVIDADVFYAQQKSNANLNYEDNYNNNYRTVTPALTYAKDGKLLSNSVPECSQNCLSCKDGNCNKCPKGTYIYGNACYESCPFDFFADNVSNECKHKSDNPVYIKAYTVSKCVNSCGKTFPDCSCNPLCRKSGDCCSDYQFCEAIEGSHTTDTTIQNCKFSTLDKNICLQCKDNFYYFNNMCILKCENKPSVLVNKENRICVDRGDNCTTNFCEKCENGKCVQCLNGYFLHNSQCLKSCPIGFRANRINFTCQTKQDFSFYWIYPSKYGCKDKCGEHNLELDCSCRAACLRRGNCCDDFEKECKEELLKENFKLCSLSAGEKCNKCKENAEMDGNGECQCNSGFAYDIQEDVCLLTKDRSVNVNLGKNTIDTEKSTPIMMIQQEKVKEKNFKDEREYNDDEEEDESPSDKNKNKFLSDENTQPTLPSKVSNNHTIIGEQKNPDIAKIDFPPSISKNKSLLNFSNITTNNDTLKYSSTPSNTTITNHTHTDPNEYINKLLSEELLKSFKNILKMENPGNKNQMFNLYMNGNISINVLTGNTNPQLINQNVYNNNSFNTHTSNIHNIDSQNKILKAKKISSNLKTEEKNKLPLSRDKNNTNDEVLKRPYQKINKSHRYLVGGLHTSHEKNFGDKDIITSSHLLKNDIEDQAISSNYVVKKEENEGTKNKTQQFNNSKKNSTESKGNNTSNHTGNNSLDSTGITDTIETINNITSHSSNKSQNCENKAEIENHYHITQHTLQVINSTNPTVITFNRENLNTTSKEIVVNSNKNDGVYKEIIISSNKSDNKADNKTKFNTTNTSGRPSNDSMIIKTNPQFNKK